MKFGQLKSVAHNIADSFTSGICLLINCVEFIDVYAEAQVSPDGYIIVDFLEGSIIEGVASETLLRATKHYKEALRTLCERHGLAFDDFESLKVRFAVDRVYGGYFVAEIRDRQGRSSIDRYAGSPARRIRTRR
jgi:hypothetical protein